MENDTSRTLALCTMCGKSLVLFDFVGERAGSVVRLSFGVSTLVAKPVERPAPSYDPWRVRTTGASTTRPKPSEGNTLAGWTRGWPRAPDAGDLNAENSRSFRRKLDLFELHCARRGPDCVTEGALLVLSSLRGEERDATKGMDLRLLETEQAFAHLRTCLDRLYKYTPEGSCRDGVTSSFGSLVASRRIT